MLEEIKRYLVFLSVFTRALVEMFLSHFFTMQHTTQNNIKKGQTLSLLHKVMHSSNNEANIFFHGSLFVGGNIFPFQVLRIFSLGVLLYAIDAVESVYFYF